MNRMTLMIVVALGACARFATAQSPTSDAEPVPVEIGPFQPRHVWPVSGTEQPDATVSGTFGPRQLAADGYRHDFHRGIDIRCPRGTPIHAIADGEVRIAGKPENYKYTLVQVRHYKPESGDSCREGGCYYSQYLHLDDVTVAVGDPVKAGDVIGHSGLSENRYENLCFEIRDGGTSSMHCIHPLAVLPYENKTEPKAAILKVDVSDRKRTAATVTASCSGDEADLLRVEVAVFDGPKEVGRRTYDLHEWNRAFTPKENPTAMLDQPLVHHVYAVPGRFTAGQTEYELALTFDDLPPVANRTRLIVKAKAVDVRGRSSAEVERKGIR